MTFDELTVLRAADDGTLIRSERFVDRGTWLIGARDVTETAATLLWRGWVNVGRTNGTVTTSVLTEAGHDALDEYCREIEAQASRRRAEPAGRVR